jgi:hypothetical protein
MIINFEKEILNTRLSKEFIEKPYKKIPENIVSKYRIDNWTRNLFK